MTDITKAIAFAKECLNWGTPYSFSAGETVIDGEVAGRILRIDSIAAIQDALDTFLAKRFYIQINRGTTSLFRWSVIVGLQDLAAPGAHHTQARADSDDLFDAIFDSCVMAARMDK